MNGESAPNFDDDGFVGSEWVADGSPRPLPQAETQELYLERTLPGGAVERARVLDIQPSEEQDIPTVMSPGFAETPTIVREFAAELAESGKRNVLVLEHPRAAHEQPTPKEGDWREEFDAVHLERAQRLLDLAEASGSEQVDLVGHSEGCIDVVAASLMSLEDDKRPVRNIVLLNPGGIVPREDEGVKKLALRASLETIAMALEAVKHPQRLGDTVRNSIEAVRYVAANPALSLSEVKAIAATVTTDSLSVLKASGVGVVMAAGVNDHVFTMDRIQSAVKHDQVDGFLSMVGGHNAVSEDPVRMGKAIASVQTSLAQRAERPDIQAAGTSQAA